MLSYQSMFDGFEHRSSYICISVFWTETLHQECEGYEDEYNCHIINILCSDNR